MSDGAWIALMMVLFFGSAAVLAAWQKGRKAPDGTPLHPQPPSWDEMFEAVQDAVEAQHQAERLERDAVLRDRQVKEEVLAELKALRATLTASVPK